MNNRSRLLAVYGMALFGVAVSVVLLPGQAANTIFTNSPLPPGTVGGSYFQFFTSSINFAFWSINNSAGGGLPPGIGLNGPSGFINGTPTTAGTYNFRLRASNGFVNAEKDFQLTINPPPALPGPLPSACVGFPYLAQVEPTGGTAPYYFSVNSASLPPGLTFNGPPPPSFADTPGAASPIGNFKAAARALTQAATLSGIPTQAGNFSIGMTVFDSNFVTATGNVPIAVLAPPVLNAAALPLATRNQPYSAQIQASGVGSFSLVNSTAPFTISVSPQGLVTATPTTVGTFQFTVRAFSPGSTSCFTQAAFTLEVVDQFTITTTTLPNGRVSLPYSASVQTAGGVGAVSLRVQSGTLPPGLTFSSAGALTGTPTQAGSFTFTIEAQDSRPANSGGPRLAVRTFTVEIESLLQITTTSLPNGLTQAPYSATLTASGATTPYTWALQTGTLPAGLQLNSNGTISGTPTTPGTSTFTVRVTSAPFSTLGSQTQTRQLSITIDQSLIVLTTALPSGIRGRFYSADLAARGGLPNFVWSITQGALPEGLSLSPTGTISGTPTRIALTTFTVRVTDSTGGFAERALSINIEADTTGVLITTTSLPGGDVTQDYRAVVNATGGFPPFTWTAQGLPPGLQMDAAQGIISGRPTTAGTFEVIVRVADRQGNGDSSVYRVVITGTPIVIAPAELPTGSVDQAYSQALSATGGTAPYRFALTSGSLASGLSLSTAGAISGTPTAAGNFPIVVEATDARGTKGSRSYTLVVNTGAPVITTESLGPAVINRAFAATLAARGGTAPYRFTATGLPAGLQISEAGEIRGTPTESGSFNVSTTVTDRNNRTGTRAFTLVVATLLALPPATFPTQIAGQAINLSLSATGGVTPYQFSGGGGLPSGLALSSTGIVSGTTNETGSFSFTATVRDQSGQEAQRTFSVNVQTQLRITTTALPAGVTGAPYNASVEATGGVPPYTFSPVGAPPAGLTVGPDGSISGTFQLTQPGSITVRVQDTSGQSQQATFTIGANAPQVNGSFGGVAGTGTSQSQSTPTFQIGQPFGIPIMGTLTLTFTPNAAVAGDDPAVRFTNNTRSIGFTIPAGQTAATFMANPGFQTGTVAGTITLTAVMTANGQPVGTPTTQNVVIARAVPVITSAVARRSGNTITLEVIGFSNTREVTGATLRFTAAAGANLQTTELPVTVAPAFTTWFQSAQGLGFGSEFKLTIPLTVDGDVATSITGIQVVLSNAVGNSAPRDATIQ